MGVMKSGLQNGNGTHRAKAPKEGERPISANVAIAVLTR